ncbi:hypothetical protein HGQ17_13830 [Nesterenkonia sp. MY13]|uniref:Nucleotide-diphospho-sugar transferase domain-containing protein n=1 Tax=Nesterenkonia sedimenti TaxID=1463632 RepID=A0A7X8TM25_9MICC|nr:hypothetical protein [Nesterenkonia sedimenti]NLS11054.1 hypothetical protein [Nesterenkonia sedimenti]
MTEAIITSFAGGKQYYFKAAEKLEKQLDRFGIDHDISRIEIPEGWDWADICKYKIQFFRDMLLKHKRPIAWIDVDTQVLQRPEDLLKSAADSTCYLRAFRYLVTFDPEQLPRLFVPSYLAFGYNERTIEFLNFAVSLMEKKGEDLRATDDYFLQEALTQWEGKLSFHLLRPNTVVKSRKQDDGTAYFLHGDSGNVRDSMDQVEQHSLGVLSQKRQKSVF